MFIFIWLSFLLAPTYIVKYNLFGQHLNLLLLINLMVIAIFGGWLTYRQLWFAFFSFLLKFNRHILKVSLAFILSGILALFFPFFTIEKLGDFLVLFLLPIGYFFMLAFKWHLSPHAKNQFPTMVYLSLGLMGFVAVIQYVTLWTLPTAFWGNSVEPKRAVGFFLHPNFYALFSAPLLAWLLPDLESKLHHFKKNWYFILAWLMGLLGLGVSLSRAGWFGLGVAGIIYLYGYASKKIQKIGIGLILSAFILLISVPNLRWRILLPFYGEKSAGSRVNLWQTGFKAVTLSPILGNGLLGFQTHWATLQTSPDLGTHKYPHNIFLTLWTESGILGLVSFSYLCWLLIKQGIKKSPAPFQLGTALFIITLLCQGLIDNPYFKNDLALVFWMIISLAV